MDSDMDSDMDNEKILCPFCETSVDRKDMILIGIFICYNCYVRSLWAEEPWTAEKYDL